MKKIYFLVLFIFNMLPHKSFSDNPYTVDGLTTDQILEEAKENYRIYHEQFINESDRFSREDLITLFEIEDPRERPDNKIREHTGYDEKEMIELHQILLNVQETCRSEEDHLRHHFERLQSFHHKNEDQQHLEDMKNIAAAQSYYELCHKQAHQELERFF